VILNKLLNSSELVLLPLVVQDLELVSEQFSEV